MDNVFIKVLQYISVNFLLFFSWYVLLYKRRGVLLYADRLIGTLLLGLAQIISTQLVLGLLFKNLFAAPLFLFNISLSFLVLLSALIPGKTGNPAGKAFFMDILCEIKDEIVYFLGIIKKDIILLCIFSLFLISVGWLIFLGYLFPSYTWDALWYHLPIVGYTIQSGAIQENPSPFLIDLFINIFPKNIELFFIWNTIFLRSDIITDLSQLFFTITGVLAVYSISVKLGLKAEKALYSSFLFFFAPVIILQSITNYVDIAVSVLFIVAVNFIMYAGPDEFSGSQAGLVRRRGIRIPVLLAGFSAGILMGSKGSGPLFVLVLSGMFLAMECIKHFNFFNLMPSVHKEFSVKESLIRYFFCFISPVILMGGYWYIKNWVVYGNPVYPIEISFFDITIFKGLYKGIIDPVPLVLQEMYPLQRLFHVWLEKVEYYLYDSRLSGFGPVWFILLLPSIAAAIAFSIKTKKYNFLYISAIFIVTFILYPRNWYTRYVIFMIAFGSVSFGLTLDYFKQRQSGLKIIALLLVMYTFFTVHSPCIMPDKIKEFISLPAEERIIGRHAPFNIDLQARQEYGMWIWLSKNMADGETLAYTFEPLFMSPLWNSSFSNRVLYIKSENYNEWMKNLRDNNVTHVLIKQNSMEDKWIKKVQRLIYDSPSWLGVSENISGRFKVVYSDENYKILSVQPNSGEI